MVNSELISDYCLVTFAAWSPLGPWVMSNSTKSPSDKDLKPSAWIAEKWTKTSSPPSCSIKPNPLASLNHLTLPSANVLHHLSTSKIAHQIEKKARIRSFDSCHTVFSGRLYRKQNNTFFNTWAQIPIIQRQRYPLSSQKSTFFQKKSSILNCSPGEHHLSFFRVLRFIFWCHGAPDQELFAQRVHKVLVDSPP